MKGQEYGIWVKDRYGIKGSAFLVLGSEDTMKREFGDEAQPVPEDLSKLQDYRSEPRRLNIIQAFLSIFNQK